MRIPNFRPLSIFLVMLFCSMLLHAVQQKEENIQLNWEIPSEISLDDSDFIPSLFFRGAVYADSMPQVPVKIYRTPLHVPHFNYSFDIDDQQIENCTPGEAAILKDAGFRNNEFVVYQDTETTMGQSYARFHLIPVRKNNGRYEKLTGFQLNYDLKHDPAIMHSHKHQYPDSSVLSDGDWYRVCVDKEGIYRISYDDLVSLGMNPGQIQKSTLQLYGNGGGMLPEANDEFRYTDPMENAIWVSGGNNGTFGENDYVLFYGQSPNRWSYDTVHDAFRKTTHLYSHETCYFITHSQQEGKRIEVRNNLNQDPTHTVNDFQDYIHHENNLRNLLGSGKLWLGELFDVTLTRDFDFSMTDANLDHSVNIIVHAVARSGSTSSFTVQAFGQSQDLTIGSVNVANATGQYARDGLVSMDVSPQSEDMRVRMTYNRIASGSRGWLNNITVNYRRSLVKSSEQFFFRHPGVAGTGNIVRFQLQQIASADILWDVTDPLNVTQQAYDISGNQASFTVSKDQLREFVMFSPEDYLQPSLKGSVPNQNLHASQLHDLTIVVPDIFREQAERLAKFRADHDYLSVKMVSPQQIYNEFSSGVTDISAIRNFMKMYYDRAAETGEYPRYLLLFGNGTYDNKDVLGYGSNFIPTFQTEQSLHPGNSYITDDFFGLLDDTEGFDARGAIDIGIGRLPVRTVDEARFVIDKLLRYDQRIDGLQPGTDNPQFAGVIPNYADWRNVITLIADDEDGNVHFNQSEQVASYLDQNHKVFNVEKIYLDSYEQVTLAGGSRYPDVNLAINNRVNQGALLINYIGHGGTLGLAHERILTFDDILSWGNFYNLPVFMTATCEFSSFDQPDPNELSAGVRIFLKPDGGAVALFTTTRLAYSHSNFTLNDAFMRNAFHPMENGEMPRLGDLIRLAKVQSSSAASLKNFVLLGDPSMQMAYPRFKAATTEIPDTIRALEKVTVRGEIRDQYRSLVSDYNGVIYPTLYDKEAVFSTLGNDPGSSVAEFTMQNRILYRGQASVKNGHFEFSFIVPRDISYNTGKGKLSYYFDDGLTYDGAGYFNNFIISGTADDYTPDHEGPEIALFLNDTTFVSGDETGPDPILLAYLKDESGINTTGQIGHDIVAFLNEDTSHPIILNNFYQADLDSYQSGRVVFPFFNLEKGEYTLRLRAWDIHNNVSSESIDFIVTAAQGLMVSELINYPNPFDQRTAFSIVHNKPATELSITIEIYSLNGQMVKSINENIYASGFNVPPIEWDGRDNGGNLLENGIYVFRASVSANGFGEVSKTEKLMILR